MRRWGSVLLGLCVKPVEQQAQSIHAKMLDVRLQRHRTVMLMRVFAGHRICFLITFVLHIGEY